MAAQTAICLEQSGPAVPLVKAEPNTLDSENHRPQDCQLRSGGGGGGGEVKGEWEGEGEGRGQGVGRDRKLPLSIEAIIHQLSP